MPNIPRIANPFEDDTDPIDAVTPQEVVQQAGQQAAKIVHKQVIKPTQQQLQADQSIVDFLYGATADAPDLQAPAQPAPGADAGIEQLQGNTPKPTQVNQQGIDPTMMMSTDEKAQYNEEQLEQREKMRLHQRNYATMGNKLDDIGSLEEQVAKVRQQKQQEEEERKKQEEEEAQMKKQQEEEDKQSLPMPGGKKTGVAPEVLKREQNKAENKTGFSG